MALVSFRFSPIFTYTKMQHYSSSTRGSPINHIITCTSVLQNCTATHQTTSRRSGNYQPPIWENSFVQSLKSEFAGPPYSNRIEHLKDEVKMIFDKVENSTDQLKLVDTLQRLGLAYHFQDEIKRKLARIHEDNTQMKKDLNATALEFRLLRQYGYQMSHEVFNKFKDSEGNFKANLDKDIDGILALYEASFLSIRDENVLDDAREFTAKILKEYVIHGKGQYHAILASHALELPLHWRMPRAEARWFIEVYETDEGMNPLLLQLAKLDFNSVQAVHQEDLKHESQWWISKNLGHEELSFARDRIIESFLWTIGISWQPDFKQFRRHCTKLIQLISTIDDIYDVYGTLDELQLFTSAVERWEISAMEQLPLCMKHSFLVLDSTIKSIASDIFEKHGFDAISHLRKLWTDLLKRYLVEAKWYHNGHTPTLEEYISNAWVSISGPLILVYAYFSTSTKITEEAIESLKEYPNIIRCSAIIFRLINDLGTSPDELKRGDVPKSIQCYMHETRASEIEAREHIKTIIRETWKELNEECVNARSIFPQTFVDLCLNITRMAQCTYLYGDGFGREESETTMEQVVSLLVRPIDINL